MTSVDAMQGAAFNPPDPVAILTERQKQVFRLVHDGYSTEEIARHIGIKPTSVVDRIESAREKLGGLRRSTIARLLVEREKASAPKPNGGNPIPFRVPADPTMSELNRAVDVDGEIREERPATAWTGPAPASNESRIDRNRLLSVMAAALLGLAVVALIKPVIDGLAWMFNAVAPTFAKQGPKDEPLYQECRRGGDRRNDKQPPSTDQHSAVDRCNMRGQGGESHTAIGR